MKYAICSNLDGPTDYDTKWSKSDKEIPYDTAFMWNLKKKIWYNELIYKTEIDS